MDWHCVLWCHCPVTAAMRNMTASLDSTWTGVSKFYKFLFQSRFLNVGQKTREIWFNLVTTGTDRFQPVCGISLNLPLFFALPDSVDYDDSKSSSNFILGLTGEWGWKLKDYMMLTMNPCSHSMLGVMCYPSKWSQPIQFFVRIPNLQSPVCSRRYFSLYRGFKM